MAWFSSNITDKILNLEKKLYSTGKVSDKYDILERIRLELDRLYKDDRAQFKELEKILNPNTWEALEDNWTLWNPVPKSHAEWVGPGEMTCRLKPSHPNYQECVERVALIRSSHPKYNGFQIIIDGDIRTDKSLIPKFISWEKLENHQKQLDELLPIYED